ncbi:MAG: hypothetical protein WCG27_01660 [Pseudomonadota bacterium]
MKNQSFEFEEELTKVDYLGQVSTIINKTVSDVSKFLGSVVDSCRNCEMFNNLSFPDMQGPINSIKKMFVNIKAPNIKHYLKRSNTCDVEGLSNAEQNEYYQNIGRDIVQFAKSAQTNENLTIINIKKYK